MRPLTKSLTPAEVSTLLELPSELVEALVENGQLLCHVRNGEARIPLDQLESFFRDALVRIYRAEADAAQPSERARKAGPVEQPPRVEPAHVEPVAEAPRQEPVELPPVEPRPVLIPVAAVPPRHDVRPAMEAEEREDDRPDLRVAPRYVPLRPITGIFGDAKFTIVQMSATGLRIRHREPLVPGDEAKLSFALIRPARSFFIRARVVWTSLAKSGDEHFSISGLRVIEQGEQLQRAIELLDTAHELQRERRHGERRASDLARLAGISDEEIALVTAALQKFANDPVEANRWYSRGRFALADEEVRRSAPARARDREEVLGIWEYLERQVELPKVAGVVTWARSVERTAAR